ncbi:CCC motif membrane protein [Winogradskyella bathintestinalis]|uniref:CCC motif membrane protein n=1 Tax=Winogradskyella bathintestinalis TaxID=3035208 RepID=A0ABT7ZTH4_9FLAO|nr:CCC motif membrane protein [Winogradskyella bathintestinalis]MDN3492129.1 CCC motif membrane protein [Winogradskyella bathintestinalis]
MEQHQQQIPNGTLILVMGILSIVGCCCYGIPGLIFGIVAIVLASKANKLYMESPENYSGYGNVKAGKIMGIIGVVLSVLMVAYIIWIISYFGWETIQNQELLQERIEEMMQQQ